MSQLGQKSAERTAGVERDRVQGFGKLENGLLQASDWYLWGPYLSERQWGTVREDYSDNGDAWNYLPHDYARSTAYRWGEDGLAGFSDIEQRLCLSLALWNGRDPILKERAFGLTGPQGNHGEDVKEYWWYLDAVPSHAWNRWRYHYPQGLFPYEELEQENARRDRQDPEFELVDTGAFDDDRYWVVEVHYAKAGPQDLLMNVEVTNAASTAALLHVLPTVWFRNTWSWEVGQPRPRLEQTGPATVGLEHPFFGKLEVTGGAAPDGTTPELLFCDNETNFGRRYHAPSAAAYPKDGINDHVIAGAATVNPDHFGTKCSYWYQLSVAAGETISVHLRLAPEQSRPEGWLGAGFDDVVRTRRAEADEFYAELRPQGASEGEAEVMRQAFASLLWSKQFYHFDVARWLDGDPLSPNRRHPAWAGATPAGVILTPSISSRSPTSGNTHGSRPGTWPSTASPWLTWTRRSPSTSCRCCAASGSSTPTARCPPTSGTSVTSTRRSRRGPPSRSSPSTASVTSTSSSGSSTNC